MTLKETDYQINYTLENDVFTKAQRISELLRIDTFMYTNLGINSTKEEKRAVQQKSEEIYRQIQKLDKDVGLQLLNKENVE